jgi:hypothetical protein
MKKLIFLLIILMNAGEGWGFLKYEVVFTYTVTARSSDYDCYSQEVKIEGPGICSGDIYHDYGMVSRTYVAKFITDYQSNSKIRISISPDYHNYSYTEIPIHFPCMCEEKTISLPDGFAYCSNMYSIKYVLEVRPLATTLTFHGESGEFILTENQNAMLVASATYDLTPNYPLISMEDVWEFMIGEEKYSMRFPSYYGSIDYISLLYGGNSLIELLTIHNPDKPILTYKDLVDKGAFYVRHIPEIFDNDNDCDYLKNFPEYQMAITPVLSSPTIVSIEEIPPSCEGGSDGKAVIHFSRAVYENELLQIIIEDLPLGESNPLTVPPGASSCTITGLAAGSRAIVLDGKYPYNNSDN